MFGIRPSKKRPSILQQLTLANGLQLTTWGAIEVLSFHFFPSSFQLRSSRVTLYIDPIGIEHGEKADFIFITHPHPDHFSPRDIRRISQESTLILAPKSVAQKLSTAEFRVQTLQLGETLRLSAELTCEAMPAYNTRPVFLGIYAHPKAANNLGYVLSWEGIRLYHPGDTHVIPEMAALKDIQVLLAPIGGNNLTMDATEAAEFVNTLGPEMTIPMHYLLNKRQALKTFKQRVHPSVQVEVMDGLGG